MCFFNNITKYYFISIEKWRSIPELFEILVVLNRTSSRLTKTQLLTVHCFFLLTTAVFFTFLIIAFLNKAADTISLFLITQVYRFGAFLFLKPVF